MYYEGTRDFLTPFMSIGFQDEESCLKMAMEKQLPRFLTIFNEVIITFNMFNIVNRHRKVGFYSVK